MNFMAIKVFIAIVKTRSISKAAESLYLSQSTVSHHLKELEEELHDKLIIRQRGQRTIHLTPKGEKLVSLSERWLSLMRDTEALQGTNPHTTLAIGCTDSINTYIFPDLYKNLLNEEPLIDLHIRTQHSQEIYMLLLNHEIDVGFVITPFAYKNIITKALFDEKMVLICHPDDYSDHRAVHPDELDIKKELFIDWNAAFNAWHDFWFSSIEHPRVNCNNPSLALDFIETHHWSIVPISMAQTLNNSNFAGR